MTMGIKIWAKNGQLWMDNSLVTWNLVETYTSAAAEDVTRLYPLYDGYEFNVVQIPLEVPKVNDYTYEKTIDVTGTSIHIYGGNQIALILVMVR